MNKDYYTHSLDNVGARFNENEPTYNVARKYIPKGNQPLWNVPGTRIFLRSLSLKLSQATSFIAQLEAVDYSV